MENTSCMELSLTVDKDDLLNGVREVISRLKPEWSYDKIAYKIFSDGITNKLVGVIHDGDTLSTILVRVFGENTEKFIDRSTELKNLKVLHSLGFGPKLYAYFFNGLAYQYLPGEILTTESCMKESVSFLVAQKMAKFHQQLQNVESHPIRKKEENITVQPILWQKLWSFIDLLPSKVDANITLKAKLAGELKWLESTLPKLGSQLVFCHNDLLLANILYDKEKHSVEFIDFEYAGANYQAYDIANHFCEFSGVDDYNPSRYPNEQFRKRFVTCYLSSFHEKQDVNDKEVNDLLEHIEYFTLASHFFWGIWAEIQAAHSSIDFDFNGYSAKRLAEYFKKKSFLNGTPE